MALVNIKPAVYVDDFGNQFQVGVDAALYAQVDGGGDSILGGPIPAVGFADLQKLPASVKPRRAYMKNPAGKGRYVICLTQTSELATNPSAAVSLEDSNNVATTYTRSGSIRGEDFGKAYANA